MVTRKIALLCDYGLDDAAATAYLLQHADSFAQIDILPIAGNFPLEVSMNNALRILSYCEELPKNVRLIDTSSVLQNAECLPDIHGKDGIGDILPPEVTCQIDMIKYSDWLPGIDESYTIVSLGPCTVTADIMKSTNGTLSLLLMGGNISQPPNYNGYEFNHGMDINAFAECVKYKHIIATLDSCHNRQLDFNDIQTDGNTLLDRFINRSVELSNQRGESGCYIYDLITVYYLLHPDNFSVEKATDSDGNELCMLKFTADSFIV